MYFSIGKMAPVISMKLVLCASMFALFLFYCILLANMPVVVVDSRNDHRLIVVVLDGFGREQLRRLLGTTDENAFTSMASSGVSADYMRPIFPTMTQPNHYALMTGMYAEDHGVIHDTFYDHRTGEEYHFDKKPAMWLSKQAEPVWLTVRRNGRQVHLSTTQCYKSVPVLNITASCTPQKNPSLRPQLNSLADNLNDAFRNVAAGDNVMAIVHTPLVHDVIYEHGPISSKTDEVVEQIDKVLQDFLTDINALRSKINVIVVSEVGLASSSNKKTLFFDLPPDVAMTIGGATHLGLWSDDGKENAVLEALSGQEGMRAQSKAEGRMLEKFHYRNHDLIAPIQIVADDGFLIQVNVNTTNKNSTGEQHIHKPAKGLNGYDPFLVDDMKAIFYAQGPQFEIGSKIQYIHSPDVYNIMCNVLKLDHHPRKVQHGIMKKPSGHHH